MFYVMVSYPLEATIYTHQKITFDIRLLYMNYIPSNKGKLEI